MTVQNRKVADEKFFQKFCFLRSNYSPKSISNCYDKWKGLWHDDCRAVSSAQIAHNIIKGTVEVEKERIGQDRILIHSELMADDLYF